MPRTRTSRQQSWLLLMEFPSHADARAAQELLAEQFSEEIILRPKHQRPSDGNVASWRMTLIDCAFGQTKACELIAAEYAAKAKP